MSLYQNDQDDIFVKGDNGTADGQRIAAIGTRLAVDAQISSVNVPSGNYWRKVCYCDMNVTTGGVARGTAISTSFTNVFSYYGTGRVIGFLLNLETFTTWTIRFTIDGTEVFNGSSGITSDDLASDTIYDVDDANDVNQAFIGLSKGSHDRLIWSSPLNIPYKFSSSVVLSIRRTSGGSKKFQAGLMIIEKD